MSKGMFEEFLEEIELQNRQDSHPLLRLREEQRHLMDALAKLQFELRFVEVHGRWKEAEEPLLLLRNISKHHEKLHLLESYFSKPEDLYYLTLMRSEQEGIEESLEELSHIFLREDISSIEKLWRVESLVKLMGEQEKRENIFYQMVEKELSPQQWRNESVELEAMGYLMGSVEPYNPTMRRIDPTLSREELEAIIMALPIKVAYANSKGELLLLKDFPPDVKANWVELSGYPGKIYYEEEEK